MIKKLKIILFIFAICLVGAGTFYSLIGNQIVYADTEALKPDGAGNKTILPIQYPDSSEKLKVKEINPNKYEFKTLDGSFIEIGSEEHSPPMPYVKLNKWDGEVSLRLDVPYVRKDNPDKLKNNKLVWSNDEYDVVFYPKSPQQISGIDSKGEIHPYTINEEGGVEFDLVLKEKPVADKFDFSLVANNLEFYYQPALNETDKDDCTETECYGEDGSIIAYRPENVVGSYAVYYSGKKDNEYKTGKAFHIYRPLVYDAERNKIWGELNIDIEKGILSVMVDKDWLNNAVYPVTIDPNIGYETTGASTADLSSWGTLYQRANVWTFQGDVTKITAYIKSTNSVSSNSSVIIYSDSGGLPSVSQGSKNVAVTNTAYAWIEYTFDSPITLSLADWWISAKGSTTGNVDGAKQIAYDTGGPTNKGAWWADDTGEWSNVSIKYSIYATYTDTTAPTVSTLFPADDATAVATSTNLVITFSEAVDAETGNINLYKTTGDVLMQAFDVTTDITGTGTDTITINPTSDLSGETDYYVKIDATAFDDAAGNSYAGIADTTTWNFTSADITAPVRSSGLPSGSQSAGTTQITMSLTTDENATCKYSSAAGTTYASMTDAFSTTGGTSQSVTISGLSDGQSYNYYVRCQDDSSNANSDDYTISFSVTSPSSGGGGGYYISIQKQEKQKQAKIQELTILINNLNQQLVQMQNLFSAVFETSLWIGLQSEDVRRLQVLLATKPEIYPEGKITGYFGELTKKAVQRFQLQYKIVDSESDPGFGYVGPKTRTKLQEVFRN